MNVTRTVWLAVILLLAMTSSLFAQATLVPDNLEPFLFEEDERRVQHFTFGVSMDEGSMTVDTQCFNGNVDLYLSFEKGMESAADAQWSSNRDDGFEHVFVPPSEFQKGVWHVMLINSTTSTDAPVSGTLVVRPINKSTVTNTVSLVPTKVEPGDKLSFNIPKNSARQFQIDTKEGMEILDILVSSENSRQLRLMSRYGEQYKAHEFEGGFWAAVMPEWPPRVRLEEEDGGLIAPNTLNVIVVNPSTADASFTIHVHEYVDLVRIGRPAPEFNLPVVNQGEILDETRGINADKYTLLVLWNGEDVGLFAMIYDQYFEDAVSISNNYPDRSQVLLVVGNKIDKGDLANAFDTYGWAVNMVYDADGAVNELYGNEGISALYLDPDGIMHEQGQQSTQVFAALARPPLSERAGDLPPGLGNIQMSKGTDELVFRATFTKDAYVTLETVDGDVVENDTIIEVYDADGTLIAENDDIDEDMANYLSRVGFTSDGREVYIRLSIYESADSDFKLVVQVEEPEDD